MHKKLELFRKSTHTTMLNPNLSSENCGKKIQSDRPKKWSKITILSPITFWENSRSWSWSDLRSLFEQVILMWSKIAKKVIGHYFAVFVLSLKEIFYLFWCRLSILTESTVTAYSIIFMCSYSYFSTYWIHWNYWYVWNFFFNYNQFQWN